MTLAVVAIRALIMLVLAASPLAMAADEIETILVTGEQPGPGLWKISRDGHVMWVLGSIGSVPGTFVWQTKNLETRIAESQEVLYPGPVRVSADIGILRALTLAPLAFKAAKNPDGATLKDVLTPEIYAKWRELKLMYMGGDDDVEKYRPMIAQERLLTALARKYRVKAALISIDAVVSKAAKRHRIKIRTLPTVTREIEIENPRAILKAARKMDFAEGECFGRNLDRIDRTIKEGRVVFDAIKVNAWATGDLEALRKKPADLERENCIMAAMNAVTNRPAEELPDGMSAGVDILKKGEELYADASAQAERNWLEAAEGALARNSSTFAVLPVDNVLSPTGFLAKLQARGYLVEEPR